MSGEVRAGVRCTGEVSCGGGAGERCGYILYFVLFSLFFWHKAVYIRMAPFRYSVKQLDIRLKSDATRVLRGFTLFTLCLLVQAFVTCLTL